MAVDVLLFGTMSDIGPVARDNLLGHGLEVALVDFPQNIFRDFCGYRRELLKAVSAYKPRVILPVGDSLALARLKPELPPEIVVPMDSPEKIELLSSKVRSWRLASELGIPQPALLSVEDVENGAQAIYKRDVSFGGSGVHRPRNAESLRNLIAHENGGEYLIEEYVEGEDLSVDCLRWTCPGVQQPAGVYFRAECYVSLGRTYTQGPSVERRKVECPEAVEIAARLLGGPAPGITTSGRVSGLDYHGVCGLDFRRLPDGSLRFLECNPRFTGGLATQIASGFDLPYLLIRTVRDLRRVVYEKTVYL